MEKWEKTAQIPLRALLWVGARLPVPIAHTVADIVAFIAHTIIRYRRKIVRRNISDSFPHMTPEQLRHTEKQFYRYLADYFFETIALPTLPPRQIAKRIEFTNCELLEELFSQGRDIVLYTSHYGNWEYLTALPLAVKNTEHIIYSHVYRHLKNRFFNNYFLTIRSRFNRSVEMKNVLRTLVRWRNNGQQFIMGFLSDQKPGWHTRPVTVEFLGRPTPFIEGTEELARKLGCAVVYADMYRLTRGRYRVDFQLLTDHLPPCSPSPYSPGSPSPADSSLSSPSPADSLTAKYAALLTRTIRRNPPFYLWSHNRWRLK